MKPHFLAAADRLPALTKKLSDIVKAKWPSSSVSAPFLPIAELSFGHLGSELPVRLGAELKIPASEVTKIIFNHLNETERQIFKIFDGFLNVELGKGVRTIPLSEISPLSLVQLKQIAIYISPLQEGETAFGFVRRAAVGALHRRLAAPCAADIKLFIAKSF